MRRHRTGGAQQQIVVGKVTRQIAAQILGIFNRLDKIEHARRRQAQTALEVPGQFVFAPLVKALQVGAPFARKKRHRNFLRRPFFPRF